MSAQYYFFLPFDLNCLSRSLKVDQPGVIILRAWRGRHHFHAGGTIHVGRFHICLIAGLLGAEFPLHFNHINFPSATLVCNLDDGAFSLQQLRGEPPKYRCCFGAALHVISPPSLGCGTCVCLFFCSFNASAVSNSFPRWNPPPPDCPGACARTTCTLKQWCASFSSPGFCCVCVFCFVFFRAQNFMTSSSFPPSPATRASLNTFFLPNLLAAEVKESVPHFTRLRISLAQGHAPTKTV